MSSRKGRNKRIRAAPIPVAQGLNKYANAVPADLYDLDDSDYEDAYTFNKKEQNLMHQAILKAARMEEAQKNYRPPPPVVTMDAPDWQSDEEDCKPVHGACAPPQQKETGVSQRQQGPKEDMVPISSRAVVHIPESVFQRLQEEGKQAVRVQGEMAALSEEVKLLKEQLRQQEERASSEKARLLTEMEAKLKKAGEAVLGHEKLQEDCQNEKKRRRETEECLAQQVELTSRLQADMVKAVAEVQDRWEHDRSQLVGDILHLRAALHQAHVTMDNQRLLCAEQHVTEDNCQTTETVVSVTENPQREEDKPSSLDQIKEELSTVKAELKLAHDDLQAKSRQWEEERSSLLRDVPAGKDGSCKLRASLNQAQKDLKKKTKQLEDERARLSSAKGENGKLREALAKAQEDQQQWEEERRQLLSKTEDVNKLKEVLSQAKKDLKNERKLREEEKTRLLSQIENSSELKADLVQAQEELKQKEQQWEKERAGLLQKKDDSSRLRADLNQSRELQKQQKQQWSKERAGLLLEVQSSSNLKVELIQAQERLKTQGQKWNEDRSRLLSEKEEEISRVKASLNELQEDFKTQKFKWEKEKHSFVIGQTFLKQANDDLEGQKLQWQLEKASLIETMNLTQQALEVKETPTSPPLDTVMGELKRVEEQLKEVRRPPKRSLRKRFLGFFKRDRGTLDVSSPQD